MSTERPSNSVFGGAAQGGAQKRLIDSMDAMAEQLAAALRRAVPFLMRQSVDISPLPARVGSTQDLIAALEGPTFTVSLVTDPGGSRACLAFDRRAITYLLEGLLGGAHGEEDRPLTELTGPQRAIMGRVATAFLRATVDVFSPLGIRLQPLPSGHGSHEDAELVGVELAVAPGAHRVLFAIGRQAMENAWTHQLSDDDDSVSGSRIPALLEEVELEIAVELGRVHRRFADLQALKVGDVIRLDTVVSDPVVIRVGDRPILRGRPTAAGTRLAVSIVDRLAEARFVG